MSPERAVGLALALLANGCLLDNDYCAELASRPPTRVASGRYVARHTIPSDVPNADPLPEMAVDREAGVVTVTRVVDGGLVVSRYRILAR